MIIAEYPPGFCGLIFTPIFDFSLDKKTRASSQSTRLIAFVLFFRFFGKNFCMNFCNPVFLNMNNSEFNTLEFNNRVFVLFRNPSENIHNKTGKGIVIRVFINGNTEKLFNIIKKNLSINKQFIPKNILKNTDVI